MIRLSQVFFAQENRKGAQAMLSIALIVWHSLYDKPLVISVSWLDYRAVDRRGGNQPDQFFPRYSDQVTASNLPRENFQPLERTKFLAHIALTFKQQYCPINS